tara:strand:- start:5454 stop:6212 length:759 start_codon:yes stop_codon:yes gene_type:complete
MSILAEQFDLLSNLPDPLAFNPNVQFNTTQDWQPGDDERIGSLGERDAAYRMGTLSAESESGKVEFPVKQRLFMLGGADQPSRWNIGGQPAHSVEFQALSELQDTPPIDPSTGYAPVGPEWSDTSPSNPHIAKVRTPSFDVSVAPSEYSRESPDGPDTYISITAFPAREDHPNEPETGRPPYRSLPYQLGGRLVEHDQFSHPHQMWSWIEDSSNLEGQGDFETFPSEIAKHYAYYRAEQDKFRRRVFGNATT